MGITIGSRFKHAWNAFFNRDPTGYQGDIGPGYYYRPDRPRFTGGNERSIITSIYNRIALDVASNTILHCKLDEDDRFVSTMDSTLNSCLNLEANIDQTGREFIQDIVVSMCDEGSVAIVPIETDLDPKTNSYKIYSM